MTEFISVNPSSFGLEINDSSLKIAKIKKRFGSFQLASFNEVFFEEGVVQGGEVKEEEQVVKILRKAILEAKGEGIETKYVSFSIPEQESFIKTIKMPDIPERDLETSVYLEAENHIPLEIEKMYLDFEVLEKKRGEKRIVIAASSKKTINSYLSVLEKADLEPLNFEPESLSSCRALAKKRESFFLVDIKDDKIDFSVIEKGFVVFSLSSGEKAISEKTVQKAKECFNYYSRGRRPKKVVVSGNKQDLEEAKKYFREGNEFRDFSSNIFIPKRKEFSDIMNKKSNYASVLGVALRGAKKNLYD